MARSTPTPAVMLGEASEHSLAFNLLISLRPRQWAKNLLVFAGLLLGQDMNLVFRPIEVLALGLATGVSAILTLDGESHWFEGVQLLAVYAMVAVAAFFI